MQSVHVSLYHLYLIHTKHYYIVKTAAIGVNLSNRSTVTVVLEDLLKKLIQSLDKRAITIRLGKYSNAYKLTQSRQTEA